MSSRKEEERNEKIIRGLMKLPPNRRCINCNSLGPQYVCMNFWTFVCMTCSGIHREFTHRVKSVSMSKFAAQEVEALQKGGNQRARKTYLKDWDLQKQRLPNSSNADKVREFIKNVYVDRRYAGGKTSDKPPVDMLNARLCEKMTRRVSSYHSYSQSPPYDYQYEERRYGKQVPVLTRKPGSDRGLYEGRISSFSSPSQLSDQMHEDRFGNEGSNPRASDYSVSSSGDPFRSDTQSPNFQRDIGYSSPNCQTPGDILNEHSGKTDADRVPRPQRTASTSSFGSFGSKTVSVNLVDVTSEPESSAETHHDKEHAVPSFPQSSVSGNFGGLDLFSKPFMPQNFTSASVTDLFQSPETASVPPVDLFQPSSISSLPASHVHQSSQTFSSSSDLFSEVPQQQPAATWDKKSPDVISKNEGWAIFDMPPHVESSVSVEDSRPAITRLTDGGSLVRAGPLPSPSTCLQWRAFEDTNAHGHSSMPNLWHSGLNNAQVSHNTTSTQSWNAFEDPIGPLSIGSIQQNSEEVSLHAPSTIGNQHLDVKDFSKDGIQRAASDSRPILGVPLNINGSSYAPSHAGAEAHTTDCKSMNPFDLPYDSDTESHNVFLNMSSLQAALPSGRFPGSFPDSVTQPWFPQNQVMPYIPASVQGALGFMGGQSASTQVPNVPSQGLVAYLGGNPFA